MTKRKPSTSLTRLTRQEEILENWAANGNDTLDKNALQGVDIETIYTDHAEDADISPNLATPERLCAIKNYITKLRNKRNNPWKLAAPEVRDTPSKEIEAEDFATLSGGRVFREDVVELGWSDDERRRLIKHPAHSSIHFLLQQMPDCNVEEAEDHLHSSLDFVIREERLLLNKVSLILFKIRADREGPENFFNIVLETKPDSTSVSRFFFVPKQCSRL